MPNSPKKESQDTRTLPDMPQSPSPYPPLPEDDESTNALDDLLASFPRPLDWDESFDDLGSTLMTSGIDSHGATSDTSTLNGPASPTKPALPSKDDLFSNARPLVSPMPRSGSKASKRSNEPSTPARPLKRLKEALSPRNRLGRTPSKVPLPKSPTHKDLPRHPSDLDDILSAFRYAQVHLARSVDALDHARTDLEAEKQAARDSRAVMMELMDERRRTAMEIGEAERHVDELRDEIRRLRSDGARAALESQGTVGHLEAALAKERGLSAVLRTQVNDLTQKNHYIEQSADRRVFELQQDLDAARQEMSRAKAEVAEARGKLDEAEFAHRALKEGGARLGRELAEKDRKIDELERTKPKRWGMI